MDNKNSRILITGASGNLGSALIKNLSNLGYTRITATCRNIPEDFPNLPGVQWTSLDILDAIGLEDIMSINDIVVHCAGKVCYQPSEKAEIFKINIEGTANVVNAANSSNIKKFIHISSSAAMGIPTEMRLLDESYIPDPTQFITDYALSKWFGELEVWRGISEGLKANILAPSVILSPDGEHTNTGVYIKSLKRGLPYYPSGSTGFVSVEDVVTAIIKLIETDITEEKYIVSAANLSWKDFFYQLSDDLNITKSLNPVPGSYLFLLKLSNKFRRLFGYHTPVPTSMANQMMQNLQYDGSKITKLSGFSYTQLTEVIKAHAGTAI